MKQILSDELCKEVFAILILFFYMSLEFVNLYISLKSLCIYIISGLRLEKSDAIFKITLESIKKIGLLGFSLTHLIVMLLNYLETITEIFLDPHCLVNYSSIHRNSFTLNFLEYYFRLFSSFVFKIVKVKECDISLGHIESYLLNIHDDEN